MTRPLHRRIDGGGHRGEIGACVMEWVSLLQLGYVRKTYTGVRVDWQGSTDAKTDNPTCTNGLITILAVDTNDAVPQEERDRLAGLIPRILRARRGRTHGEERTVNKLLSLRIASSLLDREEDAGLRKLLREAGEAILRGDPLFPDGYTVPEVKLDEGQLARHARQIAIGLLSALVDDDEDVDIRLPTNLHWSPYFYECGDKVALLETALDLHEKVMADLGLLGDDDPEPNYADPEAVEALVRELTR